MRLASFRELTRDLQLNRAVSIPLGDGVNQSFPVLVSYGSKLYDALFFYRTWKTQVVGSGRPFAWILYDCETGEPALCADCTLSDFIDARRYPLDTEVSCELPGPMENHVREQQAAQLLELYDKLRQFAFTPSPTPAQKETLCAYQTLFEALCPVGHRAFYLSLASEFFRWVQLFQNVAPEVEASAFDDEAQKNINQASDLATADVQRQVLEGIYKIAARFEEKIAYDEHKEKLFNEMHRELSSYKNGLLDMVTVPMERDVIKQIDDIGRTIEAYRGKAPSRETYNRFFALFEGVKQDLVDLLYRHGIEPYSVEGDTVDIQRQQILSTIPTGDAALDKTTAQRHAQGWEKMGHVVRPERISVWVYQPDGEKSN